MLKPGDVVVANFVGAANIKRRPAVVLSSDVYHSTRPDYVLGLITSQTASATGPTDYVIQDWAASSLRQPSAFRAFLYTCPRTDVLAHIGRLSERDWQEVRSRVKTALVSL